MIIKYKPYGERWKTWKGTLISFQKEHQIDPQVYNRKLKQGYKIFTIPTLIVEGRTRRGSLEIESPNWGK